MDSWHRKRLVVFLQNITGHEVSCVFFYLIVMYYPVDTFISKTAKLFKIYSILYDVPADIYFDLVLSFIYSKIYILCIYVQLFFL